jgi:hypothetical protein
MGRAIEFLLYLSAVAFVSVYYRPLKAALPAFPLISMLIVYCVGASTLAVRARKYLEQCDRPLGEDE